jgi:type IV secretory pathway VirB10-like protein
VTPRHIALAVGSLVVLIAGLYLFVEVRSAPAQPPSSPHTVTPTTPPVVAVANDKPAPPPPPPSPPVVEPDPPAAPPEDAAVADKPERPQINNPFRPKLGGITGKLETAMTEANKAYDRGDMDEARQLAQKILARQPGNERMLRIMVSSSCMDGDAAEAQKYYNQLPPHDRGAMKTRCERYGVTFTDPPTQ